MHTATERLKARGESPLPLNMPNQGRGQARRTCVWHARHVRSRFPWDKPAGGSGGAAFTRFSPMSSPTGRARRPAQTSCQPH